MKNSRPERTTIDSGEIEAGAREKGREGALGVASLAAPTLLSHSGSRNQGARSGAGRPDGAIPPSKGPPAALGCDLRGLGAGPKGAAPGPVRLRNPPSAACRLVENGSNPFGQAQTLRLGLRFPSCLGV